MADDQDQEKDRWFEKPYATLPMWLSRHEGLSHAQLHILLVLSALLGGRQGRWVHTSYRRIAELASTDIQTVSTAVNLFIEKGWIETKGARNYRFYKLDRNAIVEGMYTPPEEEEEFA